MAKKAAKKKSTKKPASEQLDNRTYTLRVRLTAIERDELQELARKQSMTVSGYARFVLLSKIGKTIIDRIGEI